METMKKEPVEIGLTVILAEEFVGDLAAHWMSYLDRNATEGAENFKLQNPGVLDGLTPGPWRWAIQASEPIEGRPMIQFEGIQKWGA